MEWLVDAVKDPRGRTLNWTSNAKPKGCLHTTEGNDWPTYQNWTVHPHATIKPFPGRGVSVRQHVPFGQAAFSLRNLAGGVQTNTDFVFQFELIGTSELGGPGLYWPTADATVLLSLYDKVIQPVSYAHRMPYIAQTFQSYPASYGPRGKTNRVRLSGKDWDAFSGWLGHQHVPENVHGDPGAFPWDRMMFLVDKRNEELDMDEKTVRGIVRSELLHVLTEEKIVPNKPTKAELAADPKAQGTLFTPVSVLANIETDQDNDRATSAEILAQLKTISGQLGKLTGEAPTN